jgi:hypothetical protein
VGQGRFAEAGKLFFHPAINLDNLMPKTPSQQKNSLNAPKTWAAFFHIIHNGFPLCTCGIICGSSLGSRKTPMSLLFRTRVQIAIKNHVEAIERLLDVPPTKKRGAQIERHLHLIESLAMLEPSGTSRDTPQIETNRRATKAA